MHKLTLKDIKPISDYEETRRAFQAYVAVLRRDRFVPVGPRVNILFENRQTILFRLQETLRAANILESTRMLEEVAAFNQLLPDPGELVATMYVEFPAADGAQDASRLDRDKGAEGPSSRGIAAAVSLQLGARLRVPATSHPFPRSSQARAVYYLRFALSRAAVQALRDPTAQVIVRIEEPGYRHQHALGLECRRSLAADLGGRGKRRPAADPLDGVDHGPALALSRRGRPASARAAPSVPGRGGSTPGEIV
ncbi:MAG: DUF3501 family protein [Candidatus Riflebacteria bacterium]|nr:DUF3501 family protein [Candidatus Riflebacteria bacterium]